MNLIAELYTGPSGFFNLPGPATFTLLLFLSTIAPNDYACSQLLGLTSSCKLANPSEERERELTFLPPNLIHIANHLLACAFRLAGLSRPAKKGRENELLYISRKNRVCIRAGFAKRVFFQIQRRRGVRMSSFNLYRYRGDNAAYGYGLDL